MEAFHTLWETQLFMVGEAMKSVFSMCVIGPHRSLSKAAFEYEL